MLTKSKKLINGNATKTFSPYLSTLLDSIMQEGIFSVTPSTEAEVRDGNGEFLNAVWESVLSLFVRKNASIFAEAQTLWNIPDEFILQLKGCSPSKILRNMYRDNQRKNNLEDFYRLDGSLDTSYNNVSISDAMDIVGYDAITNKGRFAVRFTKYLWDSYKIKSDEIFKTSLGNIYNNYKEVSNEFKVKVVDDFSWYDGEFGKSDSCWWGCYRDSRDTLTFYGGYCLQRFDGHGNGVGRFWLLPINDNCLIGFNAYGFSGREASSVIARKFEIETGKQWVFGKRNWRNTSDDCDYPYINGNNGHNNEGGSKVFAIYTGEKPDSDIVMCLDRHCGIYHVTVCSQCDDEIDTNGGDYHEVGGTIYCDDCYHENFSSCDNCGNVVENYEMNDVSDGMVCDYCMQRHYTQCDACGVYYNDDDTTMREFADKSGVFCPSCFDHKFQFECPTCGDSYTNRYHAGVTVKDELYCADCGEEAQAKLDAENEEVA